MNRDMLRQTINVVALLATIVINALANILPINGQTTGDISNKFPVYFVPANYVFSIWSLIYLGLLAFVVYQALPGQRENPVLRRIGYAFALSCVANSLWIFLWHYEYFVFTLLVMGLLLASLVVVYVRVQQADLSVADRWFVQVPFSIYLAWTTVATIANATVVLYNSAWNGLGVSAEIWTAIMLAVGTLLAALVTLSRRDVAYTAVIVWAFVGIAVKHAEVPVVVTAAVIASFAAVVLLVVNVVRRRQVPQRMRVRVA